MNLSEIAIKGNNETCFPWLFETLLEGREYAIE